MKPAAPRDRTSLVRLHVILMIWGLLGVAGDLGAQPARDVVHVEPAEVDVVQRAPDVARADQHAPPVPWHGRLVGDLEIGNLPVLLVFEIDRRFGAGHRSDTRTRRSFSAAGAHSRTAAEEGIGKNSSRRLAH